MHQEPRSNLAPSPVADAVIGARLRRARELVGTFTVATAAARAGIPRGLYAQLESGDLTPTREQLAAIAAALGQPEIAAWPLPERDQALVADVVRLHRELGKVLGAVDPAAGGPTAHEVSAIYSTEAADRAAGLGLSAAWARVLNREAEKLRRELAASNRRGLQFFTIESLAGPRRRQLLAAFDLDRRESIEPVARGSPRRGRGPEPPQNDDALPPGEIPT